MLNQKTLFISASLSAGSASNVKGHLQLQPVAKNLPPNDPIDTAIFRPIQSWQLRKSSHRLHVLLGRNIDLVSGMIVHQLVAID